MKHILYAALFADFGADGDVSKGYSYEHTHMHPAFKKLHDAGKIVLHEHFFDLHNHKSGLNALVENAKKGVYDAIFMAPVNHGINIPLPEARKIISAGVPLYSYDCDPYRRFDNPGERWVLGRWQEGYFTHALIPAPHMIPVYEKHGIPVDLMPFGAPDWCDRIWGCEEKYDVSLVGQCHGLRRQVIDEIRAAGIRVHVWGHFWPDHPDNHPRVDEFTMNQIFNETKVNLNLRWISQPPYPGQYKGREYELFAAGAFMLATKHPECEGLDNIQPGHNCDEAFYVSELIDKIKHYLDHEDERHDMAANGYAIRSEVLFSTLIKDWVKGLE